MADFNQVPSGQPTISSITTTNLTNVIVNTGDYLNIPSGSQISGTENFTIECWAFVESYPINDVKILYSQFSGNNVYLSWELSYTGYLRLLIGDTSTYLTTNVKLPTNTWVHLAIIRSGTTFIMFQNGVQVASAVTSATISIGTARIGRGDGSNISKDWIGFIDDFRITKSVARYTSNFIPPIYGFIETNNLDPYYDNVSLLLHMNGSNDSTTFIDNSINIITVTPYGNAKISTIQSKFGGSSLYCDANNDYLSFTPINIGASEDATLECYIYPIITTDLGIFGDSSGNNMQLLAILNNKIYAYWNDKEVEGGTIISNSWSHVAITRASGTLRVFINGVLVGTTLGSTQEIFLNKIGKTIYRGDFNGYIDEVRITKGVARYTSNFTPLTKEFFGYTPDPYRSNVNLYLPFEGSNGSTTFVDSSTNAWPITAYGSAQISTIDRKYGNSSGYFNGSSYLRWSGVTLSGDFTLEAWFNAANITNDCAIFGNTSGNVQLLRFNHQMIGNVMSYNDGYITNGSTTDLNGINSGSFYHIAMTRSSGIVRLFINGVLKQTVNNYTSSITINTVGAGYGGYSNPWNGFLDEVRITNGVARYTSSFTPPTSSFLTDSESTPTDLYFSSVSLLLPFSGTNGSSTFTDKSNNNTTITAYDNARISTAQSKYGQSSGYFDGSGDYISAPASELYAFGLGDFTVETWIYLISGSSAITNRGSSPQNGTWAFQIGDQVFRFIEGSTGTPGVFSSTYVPLNTWTHIAACRFNGTLRLFINGIQVSDGRNVTDFSYYQNPLFS